MSSHAVGMYGCKNNAVMYTASKVVRMITSLRCFVSSPFNFHGSAWVMYLFAAFAELMANSQACCNWNDSIARSVFNLNRPTSITFSKIGTSGTRPSQFFEHKCVAL